MNTLYNMRERLWRIFFKLFKFMWVQQHANIKNKHTFTYYAYICMYLYILLCYLKLSYCLPSLQLLLFLLLTHLLTALVSAAHSRSLFCAKLHLKFALKSSMQFILVCVMCFAFQLLLLLAPVQRSLSTQKKSSRKWFIVEF